MECRETGLTRCRGLQMSVGPRALCLCTGRMHLSDQQQCKAAEAAQCLLKCPDFQNTSHQGSIPGSQARAAGEAGGAGHAHRGGLLRARGGEGERLPRLDPDALPLGPLPRPHCALQCRRAPCCHAEAGYWGLCEFIWTTAVALPRASAMVRALLPCQARLV